MRAALRAIASDPVAAARQLVPAIAARAPAADRRERTLDADVADLCAAALLRAPLPANSGGVGLCWEPGSIAAGVDVLRLLGRANLAVARLYEGHVNALKLVFLYGTARTRRSVATMVADGALLAVWGANGTLPVTGRARGDGFRLVGAKAYASGLGLVRRAVVSFGDEAGAERLALVAADDPARADISGWSVSGMRATASGTFDATGLDVDADTVLGGPGAYQIEPHFHGGTWRYAAAQLGGIEALVEAMRRDLAARGRLTDAHQAARFGRATMAAETARLWVSAAAQTVEAPNAMPATATRAVLARLAVERAATETMAEVDRALGAASFFDAHPVERLRRDLAFYVRQAGPDGALHAAALALAEAPAAVGDFWEGTPCSH